MNIQLLTTEYGWIPLEKYSKEHLYIIDKLTRKYIGFESCEMFEFSGEIFEFSNRNKWKTYCLGSSFVYYKNNNNNMLIGSNEVKTLARNLSVYSPTFLTYSEEIDPDASTLFFSNAIKQHRIPENIINCNSRTCLNFINEWIQVHNGLVADDCNNAHLLQIAAIRAGFDAVVDKSSTGQFMVKLNDREQIINYVRVKESKINLMLPKPTENWMGIVCMIENSLSLL